MGYGIYGKQTYDFNDGDSGKIRSKALEFLFASQFHIINNFDLLGKLGGVRQTISLSGFHDHDNQTQIRPEVGIGGAYNFTPHLSSDIDLRSCFWPKISDIDSVDANKHEA